MVTGPCAHAFHRCRDRPTARLHHGRDRSADRGDRAGRLEGHQSRAALKRSVAVFGRRAAHEVADLADAVARVHPDALLVDVNCWGALSAAEAGAIPWACFSPYTPPLRSRGVPPFGLGLKPLPGVLGRVRDAAVRTAVVGASRKGNAAADQRDSREGQCTGRSRRWTSFLRRAPLMLVASGKPFQYPQTDWGDAVQMIGPCVLDPEPDSIPRLAGLDRPAHRSRHDVVGETGRRQPGPNRDDRIGR